MIEQLLQQNPELPITLIATDDDKNRHAEIDQLYANINGVNLKKVVFAEMAADVLRYRIDRSWQGELPRSYFVSTAQQRNGHSGLLTTKQVLTFFR